MLRLQMCAASSERAQRLCRDPFPEGSSELFSVSQQSMTASGVRASLLWLFRNISLPWMDACSDNGKREKRKHQVQKFTLTAWEADAVLINFSSFQPGKHNRHQPQHGGWESQLDLQFMELPKHSMEVENLLTTKSICRVEKRM